MRTDSASRRQRRALAIAAALAAPSTHAVDRNWSNPAGGLFNTAANWGGSPPPGPADNAVFNLNDTGYTVTFSGPVTNDQLRVLNDNPTLALAGHTYTLDGVLPLVLGVSASDNARLTLSNGTIGSGLARIGFGPGSQGQLTLNSNARFNIANDLIVANAGTTGRVSINAGALSAEDAFIGAAAGSDGQLTASGTNASFVATGFVSVAANGGNGTLNGFGGAKLSILHLALGQSGGTGAFSLAGANTSYTSTGSLTLGSGIDAVGRLNVSNGALFSNANANLGTGGYAELSVSNATWINSGQLAAGNTGDASLRFQDSNVSTGSVFFGISPGGTVRAALAGGAAAWTNSASLIVGSSGDAELTVDAGRLRANGGMNVAFMNGSRGALRLTNGALVQVAGAPLEIATAGNGSATVERRSGLASAQDVVVGSFLNATGALTVRDNGSYLDAAANLTVGSGGFGSLHVLDGGAVVVTGNALLASQQGSRSDVIATGGDARFEAEIISVGGTTVAPGGFATLTVGQSALARARSTLNLWGQSTINLDGGTLTAGSLVNSGGDFNFNSGTLNLTTGATTFVVGAAGPLGYTLHLDQARAVNATNITFIAPDGLLLLQGGTYAAGNTVINSGEIQLHHPASRFTGTGVVNNSGLLTGDGRIDIRINNLAPGEIRADAGDRLRFTSPATNAGVINLAGGTLEFSAPINNQAAGRILGRGTLHFDGGFTNAGQLQLSAGLTDLHGNVTGNAGSKIIVTGQATATFFNNVTLAPGAEFRISTNSAAVFFGNVTGAANFTGAGAKYFEGGAAASLAALETPGSTTVEAGGSLTVDRIRETSLTVNGAVTLRPSGAPTGASKVNQLAINPGGQLDLADNALLIDYDPAVPSPIHGVRADLLTGALTSSTTITNPNTSLAYGEAPALFDYSAGPVTYGDLALDPSTLFIKLTIKGDANLDGAVDFSDLVALAQNYNDSTGSAVWTTGDFTYDGNVNFNDLVALAQNYNTSLPAPISNAPAGFEQDLAAALAQVPEPALITPIALTCALYASRRRRRHQTEPSPAWIRS